MPPSSHHSASCESDHAHGRDILHMVMLRTDSAYGYAVHGRAVHGQAVHMVVLCIWGRAVHIHMVVPCLWSCCTHGRAVHMVVLCTWGRAVHVVVLCMVMPCPWSLLHGSIKSGTVAHLC